MAMCSASATFSDVPDSKKGGAALPAKRAGSPLVVECKHGPWQVRMVSSLPLEIVMNPTDDYGPLVESDLGSRCQGTRCGSLSPSGHSTPLADSIDCSRIGCESAGFHRTHRRSK